MAQLWWLEMKQMYFQLQTAKEQTLLINWVFGQNDHGSRSDFFQKYKYKKRIMIRIVFPRSTKKGFYLLWLSFSIHNLSPDHAKNDPDHAKNDPKLPNLSKLCGFSEKRSGSWSSFYTCISEKNRIMNRIVLAWSGLKLWIKNDNHRR